VEDVLMMVAAVLVIVQRLGLTCMDLGERRLGLIVLRITSRMLEGTARDGGGRWLAGPRRSHGVGGSRGCAGSRRGRSWLMILRWVIRKTVLVVIIVLMKAASGEEK